jgi:hypothetical protein
MERSAESPDLHRAGAEELAAGAGSSHALRIGSTVGARGTDPGLLRLSYVCRADTLLRGRAGRSAVLARIHGLFDESPGAPPDSGALADLARLIDRSRDSTSNWDRGIETGSRAGRASEAART